MYIVYFHLVIQLIHCILKSFILVSKNLNGRGETISAWIINIPGGGGGKLICGARFYFAPMV